MEKKRWNEKKEIEADKQKGILRKCNKNKRYKMNNMKITDGFRGEKEEMNEN